MTSIALAAVLLQAGGTADLSYVRHAETVANATGKYNSETLNTFSAKGEDQVIALTKVLQKQPKYDLILVSPSPRAIQTVLPYLKSTKQKATIWPLLYECCTQKRPENAHATSFSYGAKVSLTKEQAEFITVLPGQDRLPNAPDYNSGLAQVEAAVKAYRERYQTKRVLLVGHSGFGGQFLVRLTGKSIKVENAELMQFKLAIK